MRIGIAVAAELGVCCPCSPLWNQLKYAGARAGARAASVQTHYTHLWEGRQLLEAIVLKKKIRVNSLT